MEAGGIPEIRVFLMISGMIWDDNLRILNKMRKNETDFNAKYPLKPLNCKIMQIFGLKCKGSIPEIKEKLVKSGILLRERRRHTEFTKELNDPPKMVYRSTPQMK